MVEFWRDVVGYEGLYLVSNTGKVKSLKKFDRIGRQYPERILSTKKNNRGYVQVHLSRGGKTKDFLLHRIVAMAFIENPHNLPQVNHKDEDKENCCSDNLEWCTNLYNRRYGTGILRMAQNHDYSVIAEKTRENKSIPIWQCDIHGVKIKLWKSASEAGRQLGFASTNINSCCRGKYKQAYGFRWTYAN